MRMHAGDGQGASSGIAAPSSSWRPTTRRTGPAARGAAAMCDPLRYGRDGDGVLALQRDAGSLGRAVTVAAALGTTSAFTWLKLPACDDPGAVFGATTLPCVVLGGVPGPDPEHDLASWSLALRHPAVRGLVVGRALLYPPGGDVRA